mgnify:CR=1 FL=1
MNWTDIFIRRPVLSLVVSALVLVFGLKAVGSLPVNQYPQTQNAIVTITTAYYGADPETIAGFITQPLETAIAQSQGIDYLSSMSVSGLSTITATLKLNYDSNAALTQIQTQISSVKNQLPPQAQQPVLTVQIGQSTAAMYMGFYSDEIPNNATKHGAKNGQRGHGDDFVVNEAAVHRLSHGLPRKGTDQVGAGGGFGVHQEGALAEGAPIDAVMRAGAVVVPVNAMSTAEEVAYYMHNSGAQVALTPKAGMGALELDRRVVFAFVDQLGAFLLQFAPALVQRDLLLHGVGEFAADLGAGERPLDLHTA